MNIGEFFLKIGISGADAVSKGLKGINTDFEKLESTSLATKAALVGVFYGLERLTGFASQMGMDLQKFAINTGLSRQELQKWQHAAMLFDVTGEEVASTITSIQQAMTGMQLGQGMPAGFDIMARMVKLDPKRINDTFYVLEKIAEFRKKAPPAVANNLMKSLNISENMSQALAMINLKRDQGTSKDRLTDNESDKLAVINRKWKEIWNTIKMIGARLVATNGFFATDTLLAFSRFLSDITEKLDKFKIVAVAAGIAIGLAFAPLTTTVAALVYAIAEYQKFKEGDKDSIFAGKHISEEKTGKVRDFLHLDKMTSLNNPMMNPYGLFAKPEEKKADAPPPTQNNTFHIDGAHGPKETAAAVAKEINKAARKTPALAGSY